MERSVLITLLLDRPTHKGVYGLSDETHRCLQGSGRLCDASGLREHDGSAGEGSAALAAVEHRYARHTANARLLCAVYRNEGAIAGGPAVPLADSQLPAGSVAAYVQDAGRSELVPETVRRLLPHSGESSHAAAET